MTINRKALASRLRKLADALDQPAPSKQTVVTITDECIETLKKLGAEQVTDDLRVEYHPRAIGIGPGCYMETRS